MITLRFIALQPCGCLVCKGTIFFPTMQIQTIFGVIIVFIWLSQIFFVILQTVFKTYIS